MGGHETKPLPTYNPQQASLKLKICCVKSKSYVELKKQKTTTQVQLYERELVNLVNKPDRNRIDEVFKVRQIVQEKQYINACTIVLRYIEIIESQCPFICANLRTPDNIKDLSLFINSVLWATPRLNIEQLQEFQELMVCFFGQQLNLQDLKNVDPDLKVQFENLVPTPDQISKYFIFFSQSSGITIEFLNQAGHEIQLQPPQNYFPPPPPPFYVQPQGQQGGGQPPMPMPPYPQPQVPLGQSQQNYQYQIPQIPPPPMPGYFSPQISNYQSPQPPNNQVPQQPNQQYSALNNNAYPNQPYDNAQLSNPNYSQNPQMPQQSNIPYQNQPKFPPFQPPQPPNFYPPFQPPQDQQPGYTGNNSQAINSYVGNMPQSINPQPFQGDLSMEERIRRLKEGL